MTYTKEIMIGRFVSVVMISALLLPLTASAYTIESLGETEVKKDFVVGPGKVELEIKPGESKTLNILVSNRMGERKMFILDVEDFTGSKNPDETVVLLGDERSPYTLRDYLSFDTQSFELNHGERAVVPITVSVPANAEPGGRYGSVLVGTATRSEDDTSKSSSNAIVSRIGTLFFVTVPGNVKKEGKVVDFSLAGNKKFLSRGPVDFRILYENKGSVYLNPYGEIKITNLFRQEVGDIEVTPWFALPDSVRLREVSWTKDMLFGRYKAVAYVNRGYDNIVDETSLVFWVLPWKVILPGFILIVVLVALIRWVVTRFNFKIQRKND